VEREETGRIASGSKGIRKRMVQRSCPQEKRSIVEENEARRFTETKGGNGLLLDTLEENCGKKRASRLQLGRFYKHTVD